MGVDRRSRPGGFTNKRLCPLNVVAFKRRVGWRSISKRARIAAIPTGLLDQRLKRQAHEWFALSQQNRDCRERLTKRDRLEVNRQSIGRQPDGGTVKADGLRRAMVRPEEFSPILSMIVRDLRRVLARRGSEDFIGVQSRPPVGMVGQNALGGRLAGGREAAAGEAGSCGQREIAESVEQSPR